MNFEWKNCLSQPGCDVEALQLVNFEERIGVRLPNDYRDFLLNVNGGRVSFENEIRLDNGLMIDLCDLFPFSAEMPDVGIKEIRTLEENLLSGNRGWLRIGADSGTGFFYLSINPDYFGVVAFAWKDDVPFSDRKEWMLHSNELPPWLNFVSDDFNALGPLLERI